ALAAAGCDVAVADLDPARAERVAALVRERGCQAHAFANDILDDSQAPLLISQVVEKFGRLDTLVCIVGMAAWASLVDMTPGQWDLDQQRNLRYFFLYGREMAKSLIERGQPGT